MNAENIPDTEIAVIGCLLSAADVSKTALIDNCLDVIKASVFTDLDCQRAFEIISERRGTGKITNSVILWDEWRKKYPNTFPQRVLDSESSIPSPENLPWYLDALMDAARERRKNLALAHISALAATEGTRLEDIAKAVEEAQKEDTDKRSILVKPIEAHRALVDDLEYRYNLNGKRSGIETGFYRLDDMLDGLQYGEVTVIGARPSQGKTALGLNIGGYAAITNKVPTLFVTYEMGIPALMRRIMSGDTSITMRDLKTGQVPQHKRDQAVRFTTQFLHQPLYFLNAIKGLNCGSLIRAIKSAISEYGIKLVIIDYLQKIRSNEKHEKRTYDVGSVSGEIKSCADDTKTAIVEIAQLNREPEKDGKSRMPKISDLADSAQIERDADCICLLHKEEEEKFKLIVAKQRDGCCGIIDLFFEGQFCRFRSVSPELDIPETAKKTKTPYNDE